MIIHVTYTELVDEDSELTDFELSTVNGISSACIIAAALQNGHISEVTLTTITTTCQYGSQSLLIYLFIMKITQMYTMKQKTYKKIHTKAIEHIHTHTHTHTPV